MKELENQQVPNNKPYEALALGNLFPGLYKSYRGFTNYPIKKTDARAEALLKVQELSFVVIDLNLYLDTHPNDRKMLELFEQRKKELRVVKKEFENKYGPLSIDYEMKDKFSWIESPWPWEKQ